MPEQIDGQFSVSRTGCSDCAARLARRVPKLPAPREDDLSKGVLEAIDMDSYRVEKKAAIKIQLPDADAEIDRSANDWRRVAQAARDDLWPLRAEATIERAGRAVASLMDRWQGALQPIAERLGQAFGADAWAIANFSEESMDWARDTQDF